MKKPSPLDRSWAYRFQSHSDVFHGRHRTAPKLLILSIKFVQRSLLISKGASFDANDLAINLIITYFSFYNFFSVFFKFLMFSTKFIDYHEYMVHPRYVFLLGKQLYRRQTLEKCNIFRYVFKNFLW